MIKSNIIITVRSHPFQWTPLMYSMIDAEFFVSCFFFIIAIIVLNFWLINLFVAVITNSFAAIRAETKKSAFGAAPYVPFLLGPSPKLTGYQTPTD